MRPENIHTKVNGISFLAAQEPELIELKKNLRMHKNCTSVLSITTDLTTTKA